MATYTLYHGDCLVEMNKIQSGSVDMILADLPYEITSNVWDSPIPLAPLWEQYLRVIKSNGVIALTASQPFTSVLVLSNPNIFRHEWIWQKNAGSNFANTKREPMKEHESILIFSRGGWTYHPQMQERAESGKSRVKTPVKFETGSPNYRDFTRVDTKMMPELRVPSSVQKWNRERGLHPTQKPVEMGEYLIRTYTNDGETILDNVMGSGSFGVSAARTGRNFIGMELFPLLDIPVDKKKNPNYFYEASERIRLEYEKA